MNQVEIRRLTADDLPFADSVRALAGWNQTLQDWKRLLAYEPEGCFVALWQGQLAGTATTTSYPPGLGWIGMVLVHPDHRRRGIGSALLAHGVEHLKHRGIACVKLDATPLGRPLYERFGFRAEQAFTRWETPALDSSRCNLDPTSASLTTVHHLRRDPSDVPPVGLSPVNPAEQPSLFEFGSASDQEVLAALDQRAFGHSRLRLLKELARQSSQVVLHRRAPAELSGFGMIRPGSRAYYLGPVVARDGRAASEMIQALLGRVPGAPVFWDVFDVNRAATALVRQLGFKEQRPLLRMALGEDLGPGDPQLQFGLIDPAVG